MRKPETRTETDIILPVAGSMLYPGIVCNLALLQREVGDCLGDLKRLPVTK